MLPNASLSSSTKSSLAKTVMEQIDALGGISDEPERLSRSFCSPAMARANELVGAWMREAGMRVHQDAAGNLHGFYPAADHVQPAKTFLLGSHLDTVPNAGKFDGPLGVLVAIACVAELHDKRTRLPFALEVLGFADEEGVRYQTPYLGSKALAGTLSREELQRTDAQGIAMGDALRSFGGDPDQLESAKLARSGALGYLEVHIEQGPVLDKNKLSVGIVTAIAGQTRMTLHFDGKAGHAGTTPMELRSDALCAAAEFILAVESAARRQESLVATVGKANVQPGASNVIPGQVTLTLDVRHPQDSVRDASVKHMLWQANELAQKRDVRLRTELVQSTPAVEMDSSLSRLLGYSVTQHQSKELFLYSGAGHDAAIMATLVPAAMLFVRCKEGISHHPDESASERDIQMALEVVLDFLRRLAVEASRS